MNQNRKFILFVTLILVLVPSIVFSQKIVRTHGSEQVRMERNMTLEEVYELAEEKAKINAIQNVFGTDVLQQTDMTIVDGKTDYSIIGSTKIKGDWIETTYIEFKSDFKSEKGQYGISQIRYITCIIKGRVRKSTPKANIEFMILNEPIIGARTQSFYNNEQIYLNFKSPVDGYLSVYIDDGTMTYRLLPDTYASSEFLSGSFVKADEDYLLFSPDHNELQQNQVEEYEMFTIKEIEYNYLYIVFSEDEFVKPILNKKKQEQDRQLPKSLSSVKFQEWLAENRATTNSFQDRKIKISITQKNK